MAAIAQSVGDKGKNDSGDVVVVQVLLNNWIIFGLMSGAMPALVADGDCGGKTKLAIRVFQIMTGVGQADGKISPNGPTMKKLAGPLTLSPLMSVHLAVEKARRERDAVQNRLDEIEDETTALKRRYNLLLAKSAVSFARGKLAYGAANKWEDLKSTAGESVLRTMFGRAGDWFNTDYLVRDAIYRSAVSAMAVRAGNCYEFSAVAFMNLNDRNVKPLDMMEFVNKDHVFVAIGRAKGSTLTDASTWGPTCAICDAWAGEAYDVGEFNVRMKRWIGDASDLRVRLRIGG